MCAKNRFALFLHSGTQIMQKTASLDFCTPEHLLLKIPGVIVPISETGGAYERKPDGPH